MIRRFLRHACLLGAALLPATSACDSPTVVCTNIGCFSGLLLSLDELPAGDFTVDVHPTTLEGPAFTATCEGGIGECQQEIFFHGINATRVYVEITTSLGSVLHEVLNIDYEPRRLNGPRCGVTCRVGELRVTIPK